MLFRCHVDCDRFREPLRVTAVRNARESSTAQNTDTNKRTHPIRSVPHKWHLYAN